MYYNYILIGFHGTHPIKYFTINNTIVFKMLTQSISKLIWQIYFIYEIV